jgi:hypothetical protein
MFKRIDANDKPATWDNDMHILVHSALGYTIAIRVKISATDIHTFKEIGRDSLVVHDLKVTDYAIAIKENL